MQRFKVSFSLTVFILFSFTLLNVFLGHVGRIEQQEVDPNILALKAQSEIDGRRIERILEELLKMKGAKIMDKMKIPGAVKSDDVDLQRAIVEHFLDVPNDSEELKLSESITTGQYEQALAVAKYFSSKPVEKNRRRFFVEAGAWNGEYLSNTLYLETKHNWTGLLVEANPKAYKQLLGKKRRSFSINACLALNDYPELVDFDGADVFGGIEGGDNNNIGLAGARMGLDSEHRQAYKVQCFPFKSIWSAMSRPKIDFFSLDVEGAEAPILKNLPWGEIDVELFLIEVAHGNPDQMIKFMSSKGYKVERKFGTIDILFAKKE